MATVMTDVDHDAFARAMALAREEGPSRAKHIDHWLREGGFERAGRYASYCCQGAALRLQPWQPPPCWMDGPTDIEDHLAAGDDGTMGRYYAAGIARRLFDLGLSIYEPDPLGAIERAERAALKA